LYVFFSFSFWPFMTESFTYFLLFNNDYYFFSAD